MMQSSSPQVLSAAATGIDSFLRRYRVCPDSFFGTLGLDPETIHAPTAKMDLGLYCRMMEYGAERSGDENFGLAYGQGFTPRMLGLIGYIAMSSPDLLTAAENLARYFPWHQQSTVTEFSRHEGLCWLTYRVSPERVENRRQDALVTLGMYCNVFRHAAGPGWVPELIELEQPDGGDRAEIEAAFGAPVRFSRVTNALVFREAEGARPMPGADPALLDLLCCNLRGIGMGEAPQDPAARTAETIRAHLSDPELDLGTVAQLLDIPRWTLQRRLSEAGASFSALLEEERHRMACRYLTTTGIGISTIACELGYAEPSAFVRAFRRWEDTTPSLYRKARNLRRN